MGMYRDIPVEECDAINEQGEKKAQEDIEQVIHRKRILKRFLHWKGNKNRNNRCSVCGEEFIHRCQFLIHLETHKECPHCSQVFPHYTSLLNHMTTNDNCKQACV